MSAILGKKIGMTRLFDAKGKVVPCTVIEAGPCFISQVKKNEKEGVDSYQVSFGEKPERLVKKTERGHFLKSGVPVGRFVKDIKKPLIGDLKLGDKLNVSVFTEGSFVDIIGVSKGKGFAGVVKRHHFGGGSRTHGQSDRLRAPGSVGGSSFPSRTFKGQRMAGRMGSDRVTAKNLQIVKIVIDSNILVLKGKRLGYVQIVTSKKR
ncbi:hypothetical protein CHS0354_023763 [Potamilus streckersoni]|uniref:Large ribosomal subunit protein uL3c n=1 Tax=Potamilus streckersoni TaxID=2493646 RepID=A0AAE0VLE8_9BIVA|nr:hypothetical protein CHS0354_023763 [Potamilus streckersoni]